MLLLVYYSSHELVFIISVMLSPKWALKFLENDLFHDFSVIFNDF